MLTSLSALVALAILAGGQTFGSLSGSVVDPLGAVLPNAPVTLVQPARQARYEVRTDRTGRFEFQGLVPGDYQLEASTAGFQTYRDAITVTGQTMQRLITLKIGRLHETITITDSDAPPSSSGAPISWVEPPCPGSPNGSVEGNPDPAIGGNLRPPRKLRDAKPIYPFGLRGTGRDQTVVVDAVVGLDGTLKEFQPREPVDPVFYDALVQALRDWRFSATMLNCVPQEVEMTITASFVHR
jgi:hypothetical protein